MLVLYYKIYEAAKKVIEAEHKSQCSNSVAQATSTNTKSDSDHRSYHSPTYMKATNACPAHPHSLALDNESQQFVANNVNNMNNNVKKSIDHHSSLLKQSTLEKSSSTNCTSCGKSLEQRQTNKANNSRTDSSFNGGRKTTGSPKSELNNNQIKHRKCLFTIRKSKENNSLSNLDDLKYADGHANDEHDLSDNERTTKGKKAKKSKKKSRTPDARHSITFTNQPLLESTKRKDLDLEFIDQTDAEDRGNLCDQCLNSLIVNANDNNNNLNNDDLADDLNQSDQLVIECNLAHSADQLNRHPTSLHCKFDPNYDTNKFSQLNQFDHTKSILVDKSGRDKTTEQKLKNKSINLNIAHQQITNQPSNKKITHSSLRERKASITLGVIMCAFIL